MRKWWCNRILY